jgi:hypothetical protein
MTPEWSYGRPPTSPYWKPPSPDRTYIEIPESKIINDFSWYEPL